MKKGNVILFYPSYQGMREYHWFPFPYLYIGPFLEKEGFKPIIIDARVDCDWRERLKSYAGDALCLGITSMTSSDIKSGIEAATISKEVSPKIPVIWGGPHATAEPVQTVKPAYIDITVSGHGERIMKELANRIYCGKDFKNIPGITYKENNSVRRNDKFDIVSFDYDIFPGFHLIDIEKYRSPNQIISIFTARGCPYNCTFCTTKDNGYSERSFDQVKEEVLYVVEQLRFKNIFFQDGTFFVRKKRIMKIANWLIESGLNIKWKAKARASSLLDYSVKELSILNKSGLVSIFFGVESGSPKVLKNMLKSTRPQDAEKSAEICRDYGIEFYVSFMFAMPHETVDDLKATVKHIRRLKKINPETIVQNCIYLPLPGTPMYEDACKEGYVPPSTLEGWIDRSISSRFEERNDITWIPQETLKEYVKIYNDEFGYYKHLYEKERDGEYESVFKKPQISTDSM